MRRSGPPARSRSSTREQLGSAADLAEVRRQLDELREPLAGIRSADPRRAVREALKEVPQPLSDGEPRIRVRTRSRA
jgi:hypothetical protein